MISLEDKEWARRYINLLASELVASEHELRIILETAFKMANKEAALAYIRLEVWKLIESETRAVASIAEEKHDTSLPIAFVSGYILNIKENTEKKIRTYAVQFMKEAEGRSAIASFYKPKIDKDTLRVAKEVAALPITAKSSITNLKVLTSSIITDALNRSELYLMSGKGAYGYIGVRMSTYDCPVCDSLCGYIIPIDQQVFPAHPRCVCAMIPIYI